MPMCVPLSLRLKDGGGPPDLTVSLVAPFERKDGGLLSKQEATRAPEAQGPRGGNEYKAGEAGQWLVLMVAKFGMGRSGSL